MKKDNRRDRLSYYMSEIKLIFGCDSHGLALNVLKPVKYSNTQLLKKYNTLYDENKETECFFVLVNACILSTYNCFCFFYELFIEFRHLPRRRQIGLKTTTK